MKRYSVEIARLADRQIEKLPKRDKQKIIDKIGSLAENPGPHGYEKLEYYTDYFRVRVGNFRIIYQIEDVIRIVTVAQVTDRRDAY